MMTRMTIMTATAFCILASSPAFADGTGGKKLTGLGEIGYDYSTYDGTSDFDTNTYYGSGSALWTWPGKWNAQGDFAFSSHRFDGPLTIDEFKIGGGLFWRDSKDGAIGGELHYQSIDTGVENDGFSLIGRGEKYFDKFTLGGYLGHSSYDGPALDLDGWQLGGFGTYYAEPNLALKLGVNYGSWDFNSSSTDADEWGFNGEVEYLIPDCTASLYAGLGFGDLDADSSANDLDVFRIGAGLRVHFGTDGSLMQRNRIEPWQSVMRTQFAF